MFSTELGHRMRQEQQNDFLRQAEFEDSAQQVARTQFESMDKQPLRVSDFAHALMFVPLVLVMSVSRLIVYSSHLIGHSL